MEIPFSFTRHSALPGSPRPHEDTPVPVRFLPDFDNLVLAHDDRPRVVPDEYRPRIVTRNLLVLATFLVDGVVSGTWKVERKGKKATAADLIISKSRTKGAVQNCNVSGEFYGALDEYVRNAIAEAEQRASANGRKTLRPQDL